MSKKRRVKRGPSKPPPGTPTRREIALENRLRQEAEHRQRVREELTISLVRLRLPLVAVGQKPVWVRREDGVLKRLNPRSPEMIDRLIRIARDELLAEGALPVTQEQVEFEIERRRALKREQRQANQ